MEGEYTGIKIAQDSVVTAVMCIYIALTGGCSAIQENQLGCLDNFKIEKHACAFPPLPE